MQVKIYTIPIVNADVAVEEMNAFLRSHRIIDVRKELVSADGGVFWSFCIIYIQSISSSSERKEKVDYKNVLDEIAFSRFSKLRAIRKKIAEQDAVPAYSVFIDAELAEFAKQEDLTLSAMKQVHGIGDKRIEKYGEHFLKLYQEENEAHRIPDGANSEFGEPADGLF